MRYNVKDDVANFITNAIAPNVNSAVEIAKTKLYKFYNIDTFSYTNVPNTTEFENGKFLKYNKNKVLKKITELDDNTHNIYNCGSCGYVEYIVKVENGTLSKNKQGEYGVVINNTVSSVATTYNECVERLNTMIKDKAIDITTNPIISIMDLNDSSRVVNYMIIKRYHKTLNDSNKDKILYPVYNYTIVTHVANANKNTTTN